MKKGGEDDEAAACAEDEAQAAAGPALASAFAAAIDARTRSSAPSPDAAKQNVVFYWDYDDRIKPSTL